MQRKPSGGGGGGMCDLPMDCVARIASLTSPGDACRLAAASAALRSVADSDDVWGRFLPPEWAGAGDALDGKPARRERESTKKEMFLRLCDTPVLLDGGKLTLEQRSCCCRRCSARIGFGCKKEGFYCSLRCLLLKSRTRPCAPVDCLWHVEWSFRTFICFSDVVSYSCVTLLQLQKKGFCYSKVFVTEIKD